MDYKKIIKEYLKTVSLAEGTFFFGSAGLIGLTEDENKELFRLTIELSEEPNHFNKAFISSLKEKLEETK